MFWDDCKHNVLDMYQKTLTTHLRVYNNTLSGVFSYAHYDVLKWNES